MISLDSSVITFIHISSNLANEFKSYLGASKSVDAIPTMFWGYTLITSDKTVRWTSFNA